MGENWQAHNNSHDPPVPQKYLSELQHGVNDQKELLLWHQNNYRPPSAHNSSLSEKHSVMGGRWLPQHCCVSPHSDRLLWEGRREALPVRLRPGGHRCKQDRVYSVAQFSKCHILIQPLNLVMSYGPVSLLLRTTIFSSLWLLLCTSRQPHQVAWPGNTAEAVQRNCSICTFSLAAATLLPTALLEVCCCDVFMKTCQIFPTISPGV